MQILFIFSIFFVLIVSNKFFLFNEEFLILISFLGFCFLIYEKLGITFHDHFKNKTILVKNSFLRSLEKVLIQLKKNKSLSKNKTI